MKQKNQLNRTETLITTVTSKNRLIHPSRPGRIGRPCLNAQLMALVGIREATVERTNKTSPGVFP